MSYITEGTPVRFCTVDPKYQPYIQLMALLDVMGVITLGSKTHSISIPLTTLPVPPPKIPGHWIQLPIVSLNLEYMELTAEKRGKNAT